MVIPVQGEVRYRFQVPQTRAGEHEEVSQHLVRQPGRREFREAVEHVNRMHADRFNDLVNGVDEALKSQRGIRPVDFGPEIVRKECLVRGEPEVDEPAPTLTGRLGVRLDQRLVVADIVYLPHDIIARHDAFEHLVQSRQAGGEASGHIH